MHVFRQLIVSGKAQLPEWPDASDRFSIQSVRFVRGEIGFAVEFTIDYDIYIIAELVALAVAGNLEPARIWD
ncbi:hypothetical protein CI1B_29830 [Bradyrhizobium ivorense]|uniref:Uncharacterized protein n=1 Tax=Bradyrhizobium ivorense TaxID=2511166 RepID=A0A508T5G5_9BRAD|nr:hypothetical protein CI41S_19970 [Bradyrhizobium ivorense]VIO70163.1 hypothetical protein CI1B_29830 [Bradyrhizobium ivorense]